MDALGAGFTLCPDSVFMGSRIRWTAAGGRPREEET